MDTFYKVVRVSNGRFFSCLAMGDWMVEYQVDGTTYPKPFSKLFVFNKLDAAHLFVDMECDDDEWAVFNCEVTNPTQATIRAKLDQSALREFWTSRIHFVRVYDKAIYMADSVTLKGKPMYLIPKRCE